MIVRVRSNDFHGVYFKIIFDKTINLQMNEGDIYMLS